MLKVGLTGGIGSGKTAVSNIISNIGIPVYNSDNRAKWLMNNDKELQNNIIQLFGDKAYLNNQLNRSYISTIVFDNYTKLNQLNSLVHPCVAIDFKKWIVENNTAEIVVKEAAILIESDAYKQMDSIILVVADEKLRINRVSIRDGVHSIVVKKRMDTQMSDQMKMKYADHIINNDGSLFELKNKVISLMESIKLD
jgi:dephospho-CoA kinase